jgi:hypothetical protein
MKVCQLVAAFLLSTSWVNTQGGCEKTDAHLTDLLGLEDLVCTNSQIIDVAL